MESKNQYVVISMNTTKVGYYVFSHFVNGQGSRPMFNANHCLCDYKVYKSKAAAEKTANHIRAYYRTMPDIITKVLTMQEWKDNGEYEQMENLFAA